MIFNAFELIQTALTAELSQQGFNPPQELEDPDGQAVIFATEDVAYSLLYNTQRKSFILRSTTLDYEGKPGDWRQLSTWLFDKATGDRSDAESIINDFLEVIRGPKRVEVVQQRKKSRKNDERNVDPLFFINRLVNIFPDLKKDLNEEKIVYGQVRYITFIKGKVLPQAQEMIRTYPDSEPVKRLCALLDDMYQNGDMDLRSIVTYVFLDGLSQQEFQTVYELLGEDLQKVAKPSRKLIGRTIKPEKKKKKRGKKVEVRLDK